MDNVNAQKSGIVQSVTATTIVIKNNNGSKLFMKLKKALTGLKQSSRMWNKLLHNFLIENGFKNSMNDNCVYTKHVNGSVIILIVWVDDILLSAPNLAEMNNVKRALFNKFRMKDLGPLRYFLGIEFECKENSIKMSQSRYVDKILTRFGMSNCKPKSIPIDMNANKNFDNNSSELPDAKLYREIIGSLIYIMTCTRPDLCYAVSKLSQKLSNPTCEDLSMAKFCLKYL